MDFVNTKAFKEHIPCSLRWSSSKLCSEHSDMSAYTLGHLIYFFEFTVGLSGYLNGVNPFDQTRVEAIEKHVCFT